MRNHLYDDAEFEIIRNKEEETPEEVREVGEEGKRGRRRALVTKGKGGLRHTESQKMADSSSNSRSDSRTDSYSDSDLDSEDWGPAQYGDGGEREEETVKKTPPPWKTDRTT